MRNAEIRVSDSWILHFCGINQQILLDLRKISQFVRVGRHKDAEKHPSPNAKKDTWNCRGCICFEIGMSEGSLWSMERCPYEFIT